MSVELCCSWISYQRLSDCQSNAQPKHLCGRLTCRIVENHKYYILYYIIYISLQTYIHVSKCLHPLQKICAHNRNAILSKEFQFQLNNSKKTVLKALKEALKSGYKTTHWSWNSRSMNKRELALLLAA